MFVLLLLHIFNIHLKLLNNVRDLEISYVNLHKIHKRALPTNMMQYRLSLQMYKIYNGHKLNDDWCSELVDYTKDYSWHDHTDTSILNPIKLPISNINSQNDKYWTVTEW